MSDIMTVMVDKLGVTIVDDFDDVEGFDSLLVWNCGRYLVVSIVNNINLDVRMFNIHSGEMSPRPVVAGSLADPTFGSVIDNLDLKVIDCRKFW